MINKIINGIINNYNDKDIAHIFSIILRMWYEKKNMDLITQTINFEIKQMNNFIIKSNQKNIQLVFNNKTYEITQKSLDDLIKYIYAYFNKKYPINYNYKLIDPIYFSLFFYDLLDKIIYISYDMINISDIRLLRYNSLPVKMEQSECYKALLNNNYEMYCPFKSNLIINTPKERLENILLSIKKHNYGYNEQYAIFYNDEPFLRDGQHRIAAVKYLNGDLDIKIVRIHLKNNFFYK